MANFAKSGHTPYDINETLVEEHDRVNWLNDDKSNRVPV